MQTIPLAPDSVAEMLHPNDGTLQISYDLAYRRIAMVNVVFFGAPLCGDRQWVLIDTGVPGFASLIENAAEERFGTGARPAAIILTHGHFDHIGCLEKLAEQWDTPIYSHEAEHPYLNGTASYPPADSTVGGGLMPWLAPFFPSGPIDVSRRLETLPADNSVPHMPGWRWIHTPGHSPGHISLWHEFDRTMIVGDAFITTDMTSAYAVVVQSPKLSGPPPFLTPDWPSASTSVQALAALEPELVVTGHGRAMHGAEMRAALHMLAAHFEELAVPDNDPSSL